MLAVVTDSTCDLAPDAARQLGLHLVPLRVLMNGRTLLDWQEVDPDAVYDHQRAGGQVSTEPAPQAAFEQVYRELLATHDAILSLHISGHLSATVTHARQAAQALGAEGRIHILDSGFASIPLAEAVLAAREALDRGGDLAAAKQAVAAVQAEQLAEFTVPTLEYLRRGGRLSRAQEFIGNMLGVRPVLRFDAGRLKPVRRVRGAQATGDILAQLEAHFGREPVAVTIGHAGRDPARIAELRGAVQASRLNVVRGRLQLLGPVIGAHVGPGTYGLMARPVLA
ncbi:fatty acid-binding protein DegV [Deinococcus sp. RL]|uniref:DegV family protein n=1 Tax=Deinococcus sp. RL TaxID=1489678 RepID=UPI0004DAA051|nr:DegV family protein [Deinococcus sp. RL]KEF35396.1 fatty acid-binding protein DegV [Deinococcus sp. RL]